MALDTRPNLDDSKFEQCGGDELNLSGLTKIHCEIQIQTTGVIDSHSGYQLSGASFLCKPTTTSIALGTGALNSITTAINNIGIGDSALSCNTIYGGNVAIGNHSARYSGGTDNVAIGWQAQGALNAYSLTNVAIGTCAMYSMEDTRGSVAIGFQSMASNRIGNNNVGIGEKSLQYGEVGCGNVAVGYLTLQDNVSGHCNTVIGYAAGANVTGSCNIYIGATAGNTATGDNKLYIDSSNTNEPLIYGDFNTNLLCFNGDVHTGGIMSLGGKATFYTGFTFSSDCDVVDKKYVDDCVSGGISSVVTDNVTKEVTQSSHGFAVKDFVGWSGGTYNKAIADGDYNGEFTGLVSEVPNANTFCVTQSGYITGLTGLVLNTTYWLSPDTAGLLTDTEPDTDGEIAKAVLVANSTTSGWVLPYPGFVISSGSSGGGGLIWQGTTVDGVGTYVDDERICAQPSLTLTNSGQDLILSGNTNDDIEIKANNLNSTGNVARATMIANAESGGQLGMFTYGSGHTGSLWGETMSGSSLLWSNQCKLLIGVQAADAPVKIYHGGEQRIETKTTGIEISGSSSIIGNLSLCSIADPQLRFYRDIDDSSGKCALALISYDKDTCGMEFRVNDEATPRLFLGDSGHTCIESCNAIYSGYPSLTITDQNSRGTILLESQTDTPADFFMKVGGNLTWDISVRQASSNHCLNFYPSTNGTAWGSPVLILSTGGTVCATTCLKTLAITLTTGAASGCVLQSDGSGNATWETPSGGGVSWTGTEYPDGITTYVSPTTMCSEQYLQWDGSTLWLSGETSQTRSIQIGHGRTDSGYAYIDLVGDTTYPDYGLRIIRSNTGANADTVLCHRGTGGLILGTSENASIVLKHANIATLCTLSTGVCFPRGLVACAETSGPSATFYGCNTYTAGITAAVSVSQKGTGGGQYYGIQVDAVKSGAGGRTTGILACAGLGSAGYNNGVIGMLCGACAGAGIMGSVAAFPVGFSGQWAGYFNGPVCGTSCLTAPTTCGTTRMTTPILNVTTTYQTGNHFFCQGADRCIFMCCPTSGAGDGISICSGHGFDGTTPGSGGNTRVYGGVGGCDPSGAGAAGGYALIYGGTGGGSGAAFANAATGGAAYLRGGAGGNAEGGGAGGRIYVCGGAAGTGSIVGTLTGGDVDICGGNGTPDGDVCIWNDTAIAIKALAASCVTLGYAGSEKFKTLTNGTCTIGTHYVGISMIIGDGGAHYICGSAGLTPTCLIIKGGCSTDTGSSGYVAICGGCGTSTSGAGGYVALCAGSGKGASSGGNATLRSGSGGPTTGADGGIAYVCGAIGDSTCGCGGNICIVGGYGYGATCYGSRIYLKPGGATTSATRSGCVSIFFGTAQKMYTCNGGVCVIGTLTCTSDCRMKKNFTPISNALSMIDCLCGQCFDMCDTDEPSIGLIAQDVENVIPRIVSKGGVNDDNKEFLDEYGIEDGMYGLNYSGFTPILIEAVKEQHGCIKDLQQQINELKDLINTN